MAPADDALFLGPLITRRQPDDAQDIVRGIEPQALRDNHDLRQHVATEMSRVQSVLDGLLVDRPRSAASRTVSN